MKLRSLLKDKNNIQDIEFNKRITNIGLISLTILVVPLIIYIHIINRQSNFYHPLSTISNIILIVILILHTLFFKKVPYKIKRFLLVIIMFFFALKAVYMANIEFMSSIFIVLITYYVLTSPPKTSILIISFVVILFIAFPILFHYKIISFYYNADNYHNDIAIIIMRIGNNMLAIGFMTTLIFYVFANNKKNIALLESNIDEIVELNEKLKQEINDRKTAETLAVQQAHNYLTLFNNSFDGFILSSEDHRILEVNQSILKISGFERHELINNNLFKILDYQYNDTIEKIKNIALTGVETGPVVLETKTKNNDKLIIQIQAVAIKNQNNYNFLSIIKDVTKQHIFLEELGKREQLYRTLFEQTNESILIMNGKTVVDCNAVAKKLYNIENTINSHTELPYTSIDNEFDESNNSIFLHEKVVLTLAGQPQSFEWKHTFADKRDAIYTMVNLQELKVLGPDYYMVVEKDITDQKKNQNLVLNSIIQTEENERKRISSDLHDGIGPLLTTIKLYTQALSDSKDIEQQNMIKNKLIILIEDAVNSISEISFNISPHILLNYGVVAAINSFIEKFSIHEKLQIEFIHDTIERFDEHIEITIYRLFCELINNTLKHANATKVTFKLIENNTSIQLQYKDNGIGFDTNKIKVTRKGMGLENFRSRIQSFNGLFLLKSKPGNGFFVNIILPKVS